MQVVRAALCDAHRWCQNFGNIGFVESHHHAVGFYAQFYVQFYAKCTQRNHVELSLCYSPSIIALPYWFITMLIAWGIASPTAWEVSITGVP